MAKVGGRRKGTPNRLTGTFREAVLLAYEIIGGHEAFSKWAAENPTEFYRIAARLIPTEVKCSDGEGLTIIVDRSCRKVIDQPNDAQLVTSPSENHTVGATKIFRPALMGPALQE